jgi:hypothetical protein
MRKVLAAAMIAAFGATVVLPAVAIVGSDGAFAATQKKKAKKKKPSKKYKKPAKKAPAQTR